MTRLRATFYFNVRRLYVERGVLGKSFSVEGVGHEVRLTFPVTDIRDRAMLQEPSQEPDPAPHFPPDESEIPWTPNAARLLMSDRALPSERFRDHRRGPAHVFVEGDASAADWEGEAAGAGDRGDRGFAAYEAAYPAAESAVIRLISWARTEGRQWWLGLTDEAADPIGHTELVDCDANRRLPVGGAPLATPVRLPRHRSSQAAGGRRDRAGARRRVRGAAR